MHLKIIQSFALNIKCIHVVNVEKEYNSKHPNRIECKRRLQFDTETWIITFGYTFKSIFTNGYGNLLCSMICYRDFPASTMLLYVFENVKF